MIRKIVFHPAAEEELAAALGWYAERSEHAAAFFADEISGVVERIGKSPQQLPLFTPGTRRVLLRRFPYYLVFRETQHGIEILAVAHAKRRPGYWKRRISAE